MAREDARAEKQRYLQLELDVLSQVKTAYYDYFYFTKTLETVARTRDLLLSFEKIARARYSVGRGLQQDVLRAQLELTGLREREEVFGQRQGSAQAAINSLLDRPPDAFLGAPEKVEQAPFPAELTELYQTDAAQFTGVAGAGAPGGPQCPGRRSISQELLSGYEGGV